MSGVGVSGLLANLPGTVTPYPTQDPALELGGFRQVLDVAARNGILPQFRVIGMCVVTQNDGVEYELIGGTANANWAAKIPLPAVSATDAQDVLAVTAGGLWAKAANGFLSFTTTALRDAYAGLRTAGMLAYVATTQCLYLLAPDQTTWLFFSPSPALATQAAWAVDAATGSDNNSGAPGSPVATTEEVSRRLSPGGQLYTPQQTTVITVAAGAFGRLDLNTNWPANTGFEGKHLSIRGAFTSTADMPLTAVTNTTNGSVRGQLTVGSGTLTAKRRIRSTSGAHIGAICYSTGSNGGSTTNHFVSAWFDYDISEANVNIANGTNVAIDTLGVSIKLVTIQNYGQGYVELRDCIQAGPWSFPASSESDQNGRQAFIVGCELTGEIDGLFFAQQCRTVGNVVMACSEIAGASFDGCCIQNTLGIAGFCDFGNLGSNCVDGGFLRFAYGLHLIAKSCEFENGGGTGTALAIANLTTVQVLNNGLIFLWGLAGSWAVGLAVDSNCQLIATAAANISIPATQQMTLSGQNFKYADIPVCLSETGAMVTLPTDAQAVSSTALSLYQPAAARGNQGATTLATAPRKGAHEFWAYLAPTVVGTLGTDVQVNAIYKDDGGTTRTVPVLQHGPGATGGVDITTLNGFGGATTIETDGVANVQFSVTGVTTQGSLQYSLRAGIRILSPG